MAVTVVANTAAQLSGANVSTDQMRIGHRQLTDAEIKAWPAAVFYEIVPASSGKLFIPVWGLFIAKFASGAYTNVSSTGNEQAFVGIELKDRAGFGSGYLANYTNEGMTGFYELFATANNRIARFLMYQELSATFGLTNSLSPAEDNLTDDVGNIVAVCDNHGSGNFTGGNAANTLDIYVGYAEITIP